MKHTANVTTVMAIVAEFLSEGSFYYPAAFFYALFIGRRYGVGLTNHEFVTRLNDLLETWKEDKNA